MLRPLRNEYKYLISVEQKQFLLEKWRARLCKDPYADSSARTPVLSLYYDGPRLTYYTEKLDGIKYRNKIRLRSYAYGFKEGQLAILEIKQRFAEKVRKLRWSCPEFKKELFDLRAWKALVEDQGPDQKNWLMPLIEKDWPRPVVQVFYMREAYEAIIEKGLRVTFDLGLTALFPKESLSPELLSSPDRVVLSEGMCILELKSFSDLPRWLMQDIKGLGLSQIPIPKYVSCMEKLKIPDLHPDLGVYCYGREYDH